MKIFNLTNLESNKNVLQHVSFYTFEKLDQLSQSKYAICEDNIDDLFSAVEMESLWVSFCDYFTHVEMFHASKPNDPNEILTGFKGQCAKDLIARFKVIFKEIPEERLNKVVIDLKKLDCINEEGMTFFTCDKNELLKEAGHYLAKGSEFIQDLAARLGFVQSNKLKSIGTPTILTVAIPLNDLPKIKVKRLIKTFLISIYNMEEKNYVLAVNSKFLKNVEITKFEHPRKVFDPHSWSYFYPDYSNLRILTEPT